MNIVHQDRVKALVDALNSGEFKQDRGSLRGPPMQGVRGHCCLGVACEVFRRATGQGTWEGSFFSLGDGVGSNSFLPQPVVDWYGFNSTEPSLVDDDGRRASAVYFNDTAKRSFKFIAEAFKRTYLP